MERQGDLVLIKDEAYTADEWEAVQRRRARDRARYANSEERRESVKARATAWQRANRERWRQIHRASKLRRTPLQCPGERCLTMTPGGRLCHFCRRTP